MDDETRSSKLLLLVDFLVFLAGVMAGDGSAQHVVVEGRRDPCCREETNGSCVQALAVLAATHNDTTRMIGTEHPLVYLVMVVLDCFGSRSHGQDKTTTWLVARRISNLSVTHADATVLKTSTQRY